MSCLTTMQHCCFMEGARAQAQAISGSSELFPDLTRLQSLSLCIHQVPCLSFTLLRLIAAR